MNSQVTAVKRKTAPSSALDLIEQYPFTQVREKLLLEKKLSPDKVDEAIVEFRKYLALIALGHKKLGMISPEVDEVWHTFILFTRDYAAFCEEVFGSFLHHQPAIPSQPIGKKSRKRFLVAYRQEFGDLPKIWGLTGSGCWNTCSTPSTNCQDSKCR